MVKQIVIDTALAQSAIGTKNFTIDPERVRNKRSEPEGCYPSEGTVSTFLEPSSINLVAVIEYDGETHRVTKELSPSEMRMCASVTGLRL